MRFDLPEAKKLTLEMLIPIRWGDMDAMGHVNNTIYIRYLEIIRIEWLHQVVGAPDAAGEGLNLHEHCRTVINLELPWNPMRLEQRIGRVDRIGQRRRVHAFHLVAAGTGEARLLDRLSVRVSRAGARVGAPNPLTGRPAWTEDAAARLIVLQQDESPPTPGDDWSPPQVPLTRLRRQ